MRKHKDQVTAEEDNRKRARYEERHLNIDFKFITRKITFDDFVSPSVTDLDSVITLGLWI